VQEAILSYSNHYDGGMGDGIVICCQGNMACSEGSCLRALWMAATTTST